MSESVDFGLQVSLLERHSKQVGKRFYASLPRLLFLGAGHVAIDEWQVPKQDVLVALWRYVRLYIKVSTC